MTEEEHRKRFYRECYGCKKPAPKFGLSFFISFEKPYDPTDGEWFCHECLPAEKKRRGMK